MNGVLPHPKMILGHLQKQALPLIQRRVTPGVMIGFTNTSGSISQIHAEGLRQQIQNVNDDPFSVERKLLKGNPHNTLRQTDLIHLGSCSKAITATAIINLTEVLALKAAGVESPKLSLNTKLGEVLPEQLRGLNPNLEQATLQHFLDHRSGFVDWRQTNGFSSRNPADLYRLAKLYHEHGSFFGVQQEQWRRWHEVDPVLGMCDVASGKVESTGNMSATAWMESARHAPLESLLQSEPCRQFDKFLIPGHIWKYSRTGYALAAYMVERATGQPFERILQEYLFDPLEMSTAGFGEPAERSVDINGNSLRGDEDGNMYSNREGIYAPSSHSYRGWYEKVFLPEQVPRRQRSFVPAALAPASDISMTMDDYMKFLRFNLLQIVEDPEFQSSAGVSLPSMYTPDDAACPRTRDTIGGGLSKEVASAAGRYGMSYRNGWIVDEGQFEARRQRADDADAVRRGKNWKWLMYKLIGTTPGTRALNTSLPLNISHDGSHGGQYCYTIIVPGKGYAAAIWANCSTYSLPSSCVTAVKKMLAEIDPELHEK